VGTADTPVDTPGDALDVWFAGSKVFVIPTGEPLQSGQTIIVNNGAAFREALV